MQNDKNIANLKLPKSLLVPIKKFLENEIKKLKRTRKEINNADPFTDDDRTTFSNSLEEDVDEQIGHFDAQVKSKFLTKQIVQIRKALTRMKLGKYGVCEKCGQMIDTDRLAVSPESTVCIKCEKDRE